MVKEVLDWMFLALFDSQRMDFWSRLIQKHNLLIYNNNFCFGYITLLYLASLKFSRMAGGEWLENLILMKTQSSVWTWTLTLDFDLGFVNFHVNQVKSGHLLDSFCALFVNSKTLKTAFILKLVRSFWRWWEKSRMFGCLIQSKYIKILSDCFYLL